MIRFIRKTLNDDNSNIMPLSTDKAHAVADLHSSLFHRGWGTGECHSLISQENVFGFYGRFYNKNDLLGFVLVRKAAEEAEILSIGTDKNIQHKGLGWRLMLAAIGECRARGAEKLFLEVDENNSPALGLYRKIGFETVGERSAYYDNGDDSRSNALVLELKLN